MNFKPGTMNPTVSLVRMAAAISEKKGVDIVAYNVSAVSSITPLFALYLDSFRPSRLNMPID